MPDRDSAKKTRRGSQKPPDPVPSAPGSTSGKAAPPPTSSPQDAQEKEVTTIPIGVPGGDTAFRELKERARRRSSTDEPAHVDPEEEK